MEHIGDWLENAKITKTEVAKRSGQSRSTLHRIQHGLVDPSVGTLREIAIACGLDITIESRKLSDPIAAFAARYLLDESFDTVETPEMTAWCERFARAGSEDPIAVTAQAGDATNLRHRTGAVLRRGRPTELRLASAGHASGAAWALSGLPGIRLSAEGVANGPSVLWCERPEHLANLLADTHPDPATPATADIIIVRSDPRTYLGEMEHQGIRYVAPMQIVLDSIGLGGELRDEAIDIIREW